MKWTERLRHLPHIRAVCLLAALGLFFLLLPKTGMQSLADVPQEEAYQEQLAHRIEQMAEALPGVSDVRVLLTLNPGGRGEGDAALCREVSGIAVVCRGGADPQTQVSLVSMLRAVFGLPASRIFVGGSGRVPPPEHGKKE